MYAMMTHADSGGAVVKRTSIYLDAEDIRAIAEIRNAHEAWGVRITDASAVRYALRETLKRLQRRQTRDTETRQGGP